MPTNSRMLIIEMPIFSIGSLSSFLIIAAGGGGKKFGVRNKILSYKISTSKSINSEEPAYSIEYEKEIPVHVSTIEKYMMFGVCLNNLCIVYSLDPSNGSFVEKFKLSVMDYHDSDTYLERFYFDPQGDLALAGCSDGMLK